MWMGRNGVLNQSGHGFDEQTFVNGVSLDIDTRPTFINHHSCA